jgi:PAS domain S-box-containing protein
VLPVTMGLRSQEKPTLKDDGGAVLAAIDEALSETVRLEDSLADFLEVLRNYCGSEVAAIYLVPPGERGLGSARMTAISGAGFKRQEYMVLPSALISALSHAPDAIHRVGDDAASVVSMQSVLPLLRGRLRSGFVLAMRLGDRVTGVLLLGDQVSRRLRPGERELLGRVARSLALSVNRKMAYELLANTRLITAVEFAGEAIEIRDAQGRLEYVNPAFEKITGFHAADVLGSLHTDFLRREPADIAQQRDLKTTVERGDVWRGKLVGVCENGSFWHQGVTESPVFGPDGRISHFVSVKRDISERVHAEQAVRTNERKLSATLDSMGDGLIVTDLSGAVVRMNPAAEELAGMKADDCRGKQVVEALNFAGYPKTEEEASIPQGSVVLRSPQGDERPVVVSSAPVIGRGGHEEGHVLMLRDVSSQQAAMNALMQSQRDFRELIVRSPDGVAISRDGCWVFVNPAFATALGYSSAQELVGTPMAKSILPDDIDKFSRVGVEGADVAVEARLIRKDGQQATFEISPPRDVEYEGSTAWIYFARDVTARKEMESQLMLADRMVSVGTMAAGVAHEVNNPLAYVMANLAFVQEEFEKIKLTMPHDAADKIEMALAESCEGAERVRLIVRDLKHFTRGDEERLEPVNIQEVLNSSINVAWNEIRHRGNLVKTFEKIPDVLGNKARMGQLFLNLLINAAQALDIEHSQTHEIHVSTSISDNSMVLVVIRDSGPGIEPAIRERIFDPFFTTKAVGEGTGLGLSICHNIVTSMGGNIGFNTRVQKGTEVWVELPAHAVAIQGGARLASDGVVQAAADVRARILVADDEPPVARALKRALAQHDVVVVNNGKDALEAWAKEPFDVMFCDVMMPGLMGMDIYEALKERGDGYHERIIFMSGGAFTPEAQNFLTAVENPSIEKPFDLKQVKSLALEVASRR